MNIEQFIKLEFDIGNIIKVTTSNLVYSLGNKCNETLEEYLCIVTTVDVSLDSRTFMTGYILPDCKSLFTFFIGYSRDMMFITDNMIFDTIYVKEVIKL